MPTQARYKYHQLSTRIVEYLLVSQLAVVIGAGAVHVATFFLSTVFLGADAGLFETPALLTALHPVLAASVLPGLGYALGFVAAALLGCGDEEDPYWLSGIALGQLGGVLMLASALPA